MNVVLWVAQLVLAALFVASGTRKLAWPATNNFNGGNRLVRVIGVIELLGAVGVVAPWVFGIWPWLTPMAAGGLAATMVVAAATHLRLRHWKLAAPPVIVFGICVLVAFGRF